MKRSVYDIYVIYGLRKDLMDLVHELYKFYGISIKEACDLIEKLQQQKTRWDDWDCNKEIFKKVMGDEFSEKYYNKYRTVMY